MMTELKARPTFDALDKNMEKLKGFVSLQSHNNLASIVTQKADEM